MHAIPFALKRVHHRFLAYSRSLLRAFRALGLTPARFDMLHAIDTATYGIFQHELRDQLGVTAPTVSRMLDSLEACGLVMRKISQRDKRLRHVRMTDDGARVFKRAVRAAIGSGAVDFLVDCSLTIKWYAESRSTELLMFEAVLHYARRQLFDRATLRYVFHPDS